MSTKTAAKKSSRKARSKPITNVVQKVTKKLMKKPAAKRSGNPESSDAIPMGRFNWNELMTDDTAAATIFYTQLFGWTAKPFAKGRDYTIFEKDDKGAAGLMNGPEGGPPPMWLAYVSVEDLEATIAKLRELGGNVCKAPFSIPSVGRIAIVQDPQGAMFGLHSC